jgi:dihydrolipoamide dehydrogenase
MAEEFDVAVIGGGPGGYVAAIRAAQLGMKVACIEKRGSLGGTCLNVGCIPSKALLYSSELYEKAKHEYSAHGINISGIELDLGVMMKRKDEVTSGLNKGIEGLFKKNKITYIKGFASFVSANNIKITNDKDEQEIVAKNIIIATGSEIMSLPGITIDEEKIVSSTGALSLKAVPKKMIVIGGGYIGLEMGSVWRRLGTEVIVVEYLDRILPGMDQEIAKQFQKILEKQGIKFMLGQKVLSAEKDNKGVKTTLEAVADQAIQEINADIALVAVGRRPYTDNLGLEKIGITLDERGKISVNNHLQTSIKHIYAIGDIIAGPMLAHKAEEEGVAAAEIIAGQAGHVNYEVIPGVVYTNPEVATVGKTEEEIKKSGIDYKVGKFPFMANSRARAIGVGEGMVKVIARSDNDEILGVHIIAPEAGTMIGQMVVAMEYKAASEDIARTVHAHPTLNEAVKEAALAVLGRAIHM